MRLKQLVVVIKQNTILIPILVFAITLLIYSISFFDSKTSINSDLAEIRYTCSKVDGLGESHALVIHNCKYNSFWELKEKHNWIDVPLLNKHFKMRDNFMREELFVNILYINLVVNSICFMIISIYFVCKFYQHQLTFASLQRMVGKTKGEKR